MNTLLIGMFPFIIGAVVMLFLPRNISKWASNPKYQQIQARFLENTSRMLLPGERIEAHCGYYPCAAVTSNRLLISTKKGIDSIDFHTISRLKGLDASTSKTTSVDRMMYLEVKAHKKYTLCNQTEGFSDFVRCLQSHVQL